MMSAIGFFYDRHRHKYIKRVDRTILPSREIKRDRGIVAVFPLISFTVKLHFPAAIFCCPNETRRQELEW